MEPSFELRGWRARPLRQWWSVALLSSLCALLLVFRNPLMFVMVIPIAGLAVSIARRVSRGRISLRSDRIEIDMWDIVFEPGIWVFFSAIRHVGVSGSLFRIVEGRPGASPAEYRMTIIPPMAEDLLDHVVELMEQDPENQFSVEESGSLRCSRSWSFEEWFPWQRPTMSAAMRVAESGELTLETDRSTPLRGSYFKGVELVSPDVDEMDVEPEIRFYDGRIVARNGMVLGVVSSSRSEVFRIALLDGSILIVEGADVRIDERVVGAVRRVEGKFVLDALELLPEPLVAMVLMVWMQVGRGRSSLYSGSERPVR